MPARLACWLCGRGSSAPTSGADGWVRIAGLGVGLESSAGASAPALNRPGAAAARGRAPDGRVPAHADDGARARARPLCRRRRGHGRGACDGGGLARPPPRHRQRDRPEPGGAMSQAGGCRPGTRCGGGWCWKWSGPTARGRCTRSAPASARRPGRSRAGRPSTDARFSAGPGRCIGRLNRRVPCGLVSRPRARQVGRSHGHGEGGHPCRTKTESSWYCHSNTDWPRQVDRARLAQ